MILKELHDNSIPSDIPFPLSPDTRVLKVADRFVHAKKNTGTN
jgi:hypothetical protein